MVGDRLILLVYLIGASGFIGSTMILSISADVLSLLTIHLYTGYLIATTIFSQQISMAGSLWRLFRGSFPASECERSLTSPAIGKRWNVLRNRTDSWDYDLDQLILGTILFTLLTFLFPTVLVYYSLFAFVG
jgi:phosphatidylinositol glycan class Q protein